MDARVVWQITLVGAIGFMIWLIVKALWTGIIEGGGRLISREEKPSLFYQTILMIGSAIMPPAGMLGMSIAGGNDEPLFRWAFATFFLGWTAIGWIGLSIAVTHGWIANMLTPSLRDVALRDKKPRGFWTTFVFVLVAGLLGLYMTIAAFLKATQ